MRPLTRQSHRSCVAHLVRVRGRVRLQCTEHRPLFHRERAAIALDDDQDPERSQSPTDDPRTAQPTASVRDTQPAKRQPAATPPMCSSPSRLPTRCATTCADQFQYPSLFRSLSLLGVLSLGRHSDFQITDLRRVHSSVEPDRSRLLNERQTPGEPARRRQEFHEPTRTATSRTLRLHRPTNRYSYTSRIFSDRRHRPAIALICLVDTEAIPTGSANSPRSGWVQWSRSRRNPLLWKVPLSRAS